MTMKDLPDRGWGNVSVVVPLKIEADPNSAVTAVHGLPEDAPIDASDAVLLRAAVSASLEIEVTTARMVQGRARSKAVKSLGFARSELRRALRTLGLTGESTGGAPRAGEVPDVASWAASQESASETAPSPGGTA